MARPIILQACLLAFVYCALTAAQDTTESAPAETDDRVGWQPNPSRRGTMQIIESCLFTILACTWSIHHPNVPHSAPQSLLGKFWQQFKWMLLTIVVPEFIIAQAIDEFLWVRKTWEYLKGLDTDKSHFHSLRYRVQRFFETFPSTTHQEEKQWSKKQCYFANMGGFRVDLYDTQNKASHEEAKEDGKMDQMIYPLTAKELGAYLYDPTGTPTPTGEPPTSDAEIDRLSKRSLLTKTLAFFQISWIIASFIARWSKHLPISQLEVITFVFALCAISTYVLRWNKPQQIEKHKTVDNRIVGLGSLHTPQRFWKAMLTGNDCASANSQRESFFRNDTIRPFNLRHAFLPWLVASMVIIGLLHLIAWGYTFTTPAEEALWRWSTIVSGGVPILFLIIVLLPPWVQTAIHIRSQSNSSATQQFKNDFAKVWKGFLDRPENAKLFGDDTNPENTNKTSDKNTISKDLRYYSDLFDTEHTLSTLPTILTKLVRHVEDNENRYTKDAGISPEFLGHLQSLCNIILQKKWQYFPQEVLRPGQNDADNIEFFPNKTPGQRRADLRQRLHRTFAPIVCVIYTIARLIIISVSLSSLRSMPDGVYDTTWAKYFPTVQ